MFKGRGGGQGRGEERIRERNNKVGSPGPGTVERVGIALVI